MSSNQQIIICTCSQCTISDPIGLRQSKMVARRHWMKDQIESGNRKRVAFVEDVCIDADNDNELERDRSFNSVDANAGIELDPSTVHFEEPDLSSDQYYQDLSANALADISDNLSEADPSLQESPPVQDPALPSNTPVTFKEFPPAFEESSAVRHFYVTTFLATTFHGMTRSCATLALNGFAASQDPGESSLSVARTIATVERRLGVSTEGFITYAFICDTCWKSHEPHELQNLPENGLCTDDDCNGRLFRTKRTRDSNPKRVPVKTMPFVEVRNVVSHLLSRRGKFEQLQHWRQPDDSPGQTECIDTAQHDAFCDENAPMADVYDGSGWRAIQAGLERRQSGKWEVEDFNVLPIRQQFVALPCGLVWQMNIDWFQSVDKGNHSSGAVYLTLYNNPRSVRFLREEPALVLVIPGPSEPSLEQLNECLRFLVRGFSELYEGQEFHVYGREEPVLSHSNLWNNVSDLPASRKTAGLAGHKSTAFICPACYTTYNHLSSPDCYKIEKLKLREDWRYLKYAFRARDSDPDTADTIAENQGIRWSVMNELPGWLPNESSLVDFMHCVMLGMIKHVNRVILVGYGMYNTKAINGLVPKLELLFQNITWPSCIGRLPPSAAYGGGSVKADQWRSQISVLPLALYVIWGDKKGNIPDKQAPLSGPRTNNAKKQAKSQKIVRRQMIALQPDATEEEKEAILSTPTDRSYIKHYDAVLKFTSAIQILSRRSISPRDVKRGFKLLRSAIQLWATMHCHLMPYFHVAIHMESQFLRMGPAYVWWTYPYERNNGFAGGFNHNGHTGGELKGTMVRGWWKSIFVQNLIAQFEALPNPSSIDQSSIELLNTYLKSYEKDQRGTLRNYLSRMGAEHQDQLRLPKSARMVSLRALRSGLYQLAYAYLKKRWEADLDLIVDIANQDSPRQVRFSGREVQSYPHMNWQGRRYGASTRCSSAQYAYIDDQTPVKIEYIFQVLQPHWSDQYAELKATFAVVRRFTPPNNVLHFPWDNHADDLGMAVWKAKELMDLEVVDIIQLSGYFILAPIGSHGKQLWVTIAYDHDGKKYET